ncbi:MAG: DNA repair protein RecN [bacterium]
MTSEETDSISMLRRLRVKNYAIIEDLELEFDPGLNVFTGETGAGKSIIIGALGFAIGERVTEDIVRKDEDSAVVEAEFEVSPRLLVSIPNLGFPSTTSEILIRREMTRNGRSRFFVNGQSSTMSEIRTLGGFLVDFHGQHEHQQILNTSTHVLLLDAFANLEQIRERVRELRTQARDLRKKLASLELQHQQLLRDEPLVRKDIEEIERLNLKEGEDADLEAEIRLQENKEKIVYAARKAIDDLYESQQSALSRIYSALDSINHLSQYVNESKELSSELEQSIAVVKEVAQFLQKKLSHVDLDEGMLEKMRERLTTIERLKRRYGKSIGELIDYAKHLRSSIEAKPDLEAEIDQTGKSIQKTESDLLKVAFDLRAKRKASAKKFESQIKQEMRRLGIESADFKVFFDQIDDGEVVVESVDGRVVIGESGADYVEFFIKTNPGEDFHALRRIASGGEISRIMLAIKKILAGADQVETVVFDEIDIGIGGGLAEVIGESLKDLASKRQVISITHLAQIAAMAEKHFVVTKTVQGNRTVTRVGVISGERRVEEIARMIGGRKPPASAVAHAEELLRKAGCR